LYKHCLINHFNEEIRDLLPKEEPFKCPKCEYSTKQKHMLMLHFGITHKVVLKFIEEAARQNNGTSMVIKTEVGNLTARQGAASKNGLVLLRNPAVDEKAFNCPLCPLTISHGQRRHHLTKHFYSQLSAEVASKSASSEEAPFECFLCRHVSTDRNGLLRHVGVIHGLVDQYVKDYLPSTVEDSSEGGPTSLGVVRDELLAGPDHQLPQTKTASTPQTTNTLTSGPECRLCDRPQHFR
jgi:hypothetical protein